MKLSPVSEKFILHWGEMGSKWGVNRTVSQIHALLYLSNKALSAEEIADTLGVARSNVSNSLKELQNWKLVRTTHVLGDRRDHFETSKDVWELFRTIVQQRKEREFEPTIAFLHECLGKKELDREDKATRARIGDTLALMEALSAWTDQMLKLETSTLMKLMKLGPKIQGLLRPGSGSS